MLFKINLTKSNKNNSLFVHNKNSFKKRNSYKNNKC